MPARKNDLRHQQASEHVSLRTSSFCTRCWSTMLDYVGDVENWRRGALERPYYAIDTISCINFDGAIPNPVPQQPLLRDILLPPLILPPSMIGGIVHGEKASVPSCYEPEAARATEASALISDAFTASDPNLALHKVFPAPSCRPTVTAFCKAKDKLAAATVLTPTILSALQGQPLPAARALSACRRRPSSAPAAGLVSAAGASGAGRAGVGSEARV